MLKKEELEHAQEEFPNRNRQRYGFIDFAIAYDWFCVLSIKFFSLQPSISLLSASLFSSGRHREFQERDL